MPSKNIIKTYSENGYYHVYNRGVEKRTIFTCSQDNSVFLGYVKEYLSPKDTDTLQNALGNPESSAFEKAEAIKLLRMNNFNTEIDLLAYCLMPNHFHFLIKQNNSWAMEKFMRSLGTRYVQYFNKHLSGRVGSLFQDTYKAVMVHSEEQLLHLTRYIHRNPFIKGVSLKESPQPSSLKNYLGEIHQEWVKPEELLSQFSKTGFNSYSSFVEDSALEEFSIQLIANLSIDYV